MNKTRQVIKYLLSDTLAAASAWFVFYTYRKVDIESPMFGVRVPVVFDQKFLLGIVGVTVFWLLLYAMTGTYKNIYRKSRLREFGQTFLLTLIGVLIIFFVLLLNDYVPNYKTHYLSFLTLFATHFLFTATGRLIFSSITNSKIRNRKFGFKTVMIGSNANALKLFTELESQEKSWGNIFAGFVHVDQRNGFSEELKAKIPHLGEIEQINRIIRENKIDEVIIAIESSEHDRLNAIINMVDNTDVIIKIVPDMYDIL